jgi:hypothetical protein
VGEYQRYRPIVKKIFNQRITAEGMVMPEGTLAVSSVRMSAPIDRNPVLQSMLLPSKAPLRRDQWRFQDGKLLAMIGAYDIVYLLPYTLSRDVTIEKEGDLYQPHTQLKLPSVPLPNTFVFPDGYALMDEGEETFLMKDDKRVAVYDRATFTFEEPCPDLTVNYQSRCLVIQELTMRDDLFLELFLVRFILALSTTKAGLKMPDLPVDLSLDNLLAYAREAEKTYASKISVIQKWWVFSLLFSMSCMNFLT